MLYLPRLCRASRKNCSKRHAERAYCDWIEGFIRYHGKRHLREMGEVEVSAFDSFVSHSLRLTA
ncbi:MAG: phage integrase N-terminal SAM-like domain-containing protein [Chthoniobacterales bacterium]